jgi:AAA domain
MGCYAELKKNEDSVVEEHDVDVDESASEEATVGQAYQRGFASIGRSISLAEGWEAKLAAWRNGLHEALIYWHGIERPDIFDECYRLAEAKGLVDQFGEDEIQNGLAAEAETAKPKQTNGKDHAKQEPAEQADGASSASDLAILNLLPIDEASIPVREWVIPGLLLRKMLTVLVAPSGSGKSLLTLQVAIALATGREWAGWRPRGPLRVMIVNAEDDTDEVRRRLAAALFKMAVTAEQRAEIAETRRLLAADSTNGVVLAQFNNRTKTLVRTPLMEKLINTIQHSGVDVVFVDPFAETFEGDENSNSELKWAGMLWREVARRTGVAICLVHHTKKYATGMAGDVDAARGASALIGIARIVSTLFPMTEKEAESNNVPVDQRGNYLRYDDAKANLNLKSNISKWFKKDSITLNNATDELPGDQVGVLEPWKPKDVTEGITELQINDFFRAVDIGVIDSKNVPTGELYTFSNSQRSEYETPRYIAQFIQEFFKLETLEAAIGLMKRWRDHKRLIEVSYRSPKQRRERKGVRSELYQTPEQGPSLADIMAGEPV